MSVQGTPGRNDMEQDKMRQRRPHHKSKTGCYACKNRRVKCDEVWPICKRCQYNHRICQRDQPRQDALSADGIGKELRNPIIIDEVSHYALEYFYFCALQNLERFEPSPIWHHIVDRMQTDRALRNAAAAIGRQQLVSHTAMMDPSGETAEDGDDQASLLYVRAIASLRQSITRHSEADDTSGLNHVLTSLLLVILESLRGSPRSLLVHLHSGIRIIRELNARPRNHISGGDNIASGSTTTQECTRLLLQYAINTMVFNPASESTRATQQLVWDTSDQDSSHGIHLVPSQRANCEQSGYPLAVPSALSLNMPIHDFQREAKLTCRGMTSDLLQLMSKARGVVDPCVDPHIKASIDSIKTRQRIAENVIKARIKMILEHPSADADRWISNLKFALAHCVLTRISVAAAWTGLQSTYDEHLASFQEIVALERSALDLLQQANAMLSDQTPLQPVFSVGVSVIPVLMCVVRQCRDLRTRREAVALLDMCPKREGLWEAEKTRMICEAFIQFEQRKAGGIIPVPEQCRIHFYQLTGSDTGGSDSSSALEVAFKPDAGQRTFVFETIDLTPYTRDSDFRTL